MKQVAGVLLLVVVAFASADIKLRNARDILVSSAKCVQKLEVPLSYQVQFLSFEYKDDPVVQNHLLCTYTDLGLWNPASGLDAESSAASYEKLIKEANAKEILPIINECNLKTKNDSEAKWVKDTLNCVIGTKVGVWFRELLTNEIANIVFSVNK